MLPRRYQLFSQNKKEEPLSAHLSDDALCVLAVGNASNSGDMDLITMCLFDRSSERHLVKRSVLDLLVLVIATGGAVNKVDAVLGDDTGELDGVF